MKKYLLLTLLSLSAFNATAWEINQNNIAFQVASNNPNYAALFDSEGISIISEAPLGCDNFTKRVYSVNGTSVKFTTHCQNEKMEYAYAESEKGRKYILDQFKEKTTVEINNLYYSAKGFNKIAKKLASKIESDKNAI